MLHGSLHQRLGPAICSALAVLLALARLGAQPPVVVAQATDENGVAALQARLDWQRRYLLQIDGPPGTPFTARYTQVFVSRQPAGGGSGNRSGSLEGQTPYELELVAPAPQLLYWRFSIVASAADSIPLTVRILDAGPS
jgi:hypothetical protein